MARGALWGKATHLELLSLAQQGVSPTDCAERLGLNAGSVKVRLADLRSKGLIPYKRTGYAYWKERDIKRMQQLIKDDFCSREIAKILGKSVVQVYAKRYKLKRLNIK